MFLEKRLERAQHISSNSFQVKHLGGLASSLLDGSESFAFSVFYPFRSSNERFSTRKINSTQMSSILFPPQVVNVSIFGLTTWRV